jgi:N-acetylglutamate synthase-like GNAT family acetyltransferase
MKRMPDPQDYELRSVTTPADWASYHRIRRTVLFEVRGRFGVYDSNHPDDRYHEHHPLVLAFRGEIVGAVRLDCAGSGSGIVRQVAIDVPAQGAGHGRMMLSLLEQRALNMGIAVLEVNSARESVGFYQRLGFQLIDDARESPLLRRRISS